MTQQEQDNSTEKSNNNIIHVFQHLFNNEYDLTPSQKNENEQYFDQFSSASTSLPNLQQNLSQLQMYFEQQSSSSIPNNSNILLNHEPTSSNLYGMLDYNNAFYNTSSPTSPTDTKKQFKFRKNKTTEPNSKKPAEPSLDALILTKHQIEQEILNRKRRNDELLKKQQQEQQEELLLRNKKVKKATQQPQPQEEDEEDDDDEYEEDEPVIGDGALSHSSHGSQLSKDDKRKRNTAASARFRIKKKLREQALQKTACEMTEKANLMEQRVNELEREIKWLRALVVEKNEARIKQLIKERPHHSIAFPVNNKE